MRQVKIQNKVVLGRSTGRSRSIQLQQNETKITDGKVKWTRDFMDEMKKSKCAKQVKQTKPKDNGPVVSGEVTTCANQMNSLQGEDTCEIPDGIEVLAENVDETLSNEELDYEDDVSVHDEDLWDDDAMEEVETVVEPVEPVPGTSKQTHAGTLKTMNEASKFITSQTEDQLYQNPIMQRMMEKFFTERFKNIQQNLDNGSGEGTNNNDRLNKVTNFQNPTSQRAAGVNNNDDTVGINQSNKIKSPSDTTIYAPALQKKLTPISNLKCLVNNEQLLQPMQEVIGDTNTNVTHDLS